MRLPAVVRLSRSFWGDARNGTQRNDTESFQCLTRNSNFGAAGAERLAGVLGQCRELVHLDLSANFIETGGAERLAGVLAQCTALAHLDLSGNQIGNAGAESFAGVLAQCTALAGSPLSRLQ